MLNDPAPEPGSRLRNFLLLSAVVLLIGGAYVGFVFYSRYEANEAIQEKIQQKAAQQERSQDEQAVDAMGGNRFDILGYSADPPEIRGGEKSSICYSVSNAKSVKIEPAPEDPTWPAFQRCVYVAPKKTTTYTMTIEDGAGHTKSASLEVRVR
ncbi:MAG TPA: hypothetical protein VKT99_08755 [Xanthobacteraceae bacterium]|nr:hypothetical protein [Xanthobacteraceae bacterium]